jgi:hypothetical protein
MKLMSFTRVSGKRHWLPHFLASHFPVKAMRVRVDLSILHIAAAALVVIQDSLWGIG